MKTIIKQTSLLLLITLTTAVHSSEKPWLPLLGLTAGAGMFGYYLLDKERIDKQEIKELEKDLIMNIFEQRVYQEDPANNDEHWKKINDLSLQLLRAEERNLRNTLDKKRKWCYSW